MTQIKRWFANRKHSDIEFFCQLFYQMTWKLLLEINHQIPLRHIVAIKEHLYELKTQFYKKQN